VNSYFLSTNIGYIHTNDERMAEMPFTIDQLIANNSLLGKDCKIFFVTKNNKDYWEFGEYV
jgi:hypothetical protein